VTLEIEKVMYDHATGESTSIISINDLSTDDSTRHNVDDGITSSFAIYKLSKYEQMGLNGSTELDAEKRLALQEEKQELEHKLLEAPKLRDRLEELKAVKTERERARAA
jgi:ATP-binding cassette subfamily D (ALD) long-chain fatty acid import protein